MKSFPSLVPILLLALLLPAGATLAQGGAAPARTTVWHTVRPGETLELIATRYLGSLPLWREIHRLNPDIADPNRIEPGQRIRIPLLQRGMPAATVHRTSREVKEQPSPIPWKDAQVGDVLVERDGVRTFGKSSAELQFTDGARLMLTEDSLVFLRRSGTALRGVERKGIEIVEGQADLEARSAPSAPAPEVEIVIGATKATAGPGRGGTAQTRARRSAEGGAKLMVYGGESEVEAGGAKVQVPQGMGTSVAASGPPSPPEPLLPAPRLTDPAAGSERACADPALSWQAVPEAASYVVEVCRDAGCSELVDRATGETATRWRPAGLPVGDLFWRVTARSASGLDGYPSEAVRLAVTSERTGLPAPTGNLEVGGPRVRVGERLFTSAATTVQVSAVDSAGTAAKWVPVIGGKEEAALPASWTAGEYTVGALAEDGCGNRSVVSPVTFTVDTEPPAIHWEVGDQEGFSDRLAPDSDRQRRRLPGRRSGGVAAREAWPSLDGVWQMPLPWVKDEKLRSSGRTGFPVDITSDHPQAFLAAPDTVISIDGKDSTLDDGRILWISAQDAGAGVDRLAFHARPEGDRVVLEVEATDLVGNKTRKEVRLSRRQGQ